MQMLVKFILRNILEKKFRTFLIVFSITLSSALFFASSSMSGSFQKMYLNKIRSTIGNADIKITSKENSDNMFIDSKEIRNNKLEYKIDAIEYFGVYSESKNKDMNVNIKGINLNDLQKMNPIKLEKKDSKEKFDEDKIIISDKTAEKYKLKVKDILNIKINGKSYPFKIYGIAKPQGIFANEVGYLTILTPLKTMEKHLSTDGKVTTIYAKAKNEYNLDNVIKSLSNTNKNYNVEETINKEILEYMQSNISTPLFIMLSVILVMSIFIIYSSFKVIAIERMPIIGTFRSVGATQKTTTFILLVESFIYGILGGIFGNILGIGVLRIIADFMNQFKNDGIETIVEFSSSHLIYSFLLAIAISILSAIVPIIMVNKHSIKDIVLNIQQEEELRSFKKLVTSIILISASTGTQIFFKGTPSILLAMTVIISFMIGVVLLVPYIIEIFSILFKKISTYILGNESYLSFKNITSKVVTSNIALFVIGIATITAITSITLSVQNYITSGYDEYDYEVKINGIRDYDSVEKSINNITDIKNLYREYSSMYIEIEGTNEKISLLNGVNTDKYKEFYPKVNIEEDNGKLLDKLNKGRNIIIHEILAKRINTKIGDTIKLVINDEKKEYRVIGLMETNISSNGRYAIISKDNFLKDIEKYNNSLLLKINKESNYIKDKIEKKLKGLGTIVTTKHEEETEMKESNGNFMLILEGFVIMALFVGMFGLVNNLFISFIQRKHDIAIFRSIGMSNSQSKKMFIIEGIVSGIFGSGIGVLLGVGLLKMIPYLLKAMDISMEVLYSREIMLRYFILGIVVMVITSFITMFKSSKVSIIEEIKYE